VLGDMKELGLDEVALHAALVDLPAMDHIDRVDCTGPLMRHLHDALDGNRRGEWAETSADLLPRLRRTLRAGDMVLVKGSLSMNMVTLVDGIRKMGHPAPDTVMKHDDE
jgi:UDP-N-acetylmuramoyl-tripeptide--D-alanyl-D-alanine ligase